jgi:hypothetical protein
MGYGTGLNMEERVTSLFQPDTLLPDQYLDTFRRKLHLEPEKKLMLAILEDAVACFQKYLFARESKGKAQFRDTEDWIFQGADLGIFSFDIVCETLGLEPNYVRRGLALWKKQQQLTHQTQAQVISLRPTRGKLPNRPNVSGRHKPKLRRAAGH